MAPCPDAVVEALVLAGGKGSRLRYSHDPAVRDVPKPLVRVTLNGRRDTMLGHTVRSLGRIGLRHVWLLIADEDGTRADDVAIGLEGEMVGRNVGVTLRLSRERKRLGTAGAVALALTRSRAETVVMVPVDTVFPYHRLRRCIASHRDDHNAITWLVTSKWGELDQNAGRVLLDVSRRTVVAALEGTPLRCDVSTRGLVAATSGGVMLGERDFLIDHLEAFTNERRRSGPADLYRDFVPWLLQRRVAVNALDLMEPVIDLGSPERIAPFVAP